MNLTWQLLFLTWLFVEQVLHLSLCIYYSIHFFRFNVNKSFNVNDYCLVIYCGKDTLIAGRSRGLKSFDRGLSREWCTTVLPRKRHSGADCQPPLKEGLFKYTHGLNQFSPHNFRLENSDFTQSK